MTTVKLTKFGGMRPILSERNLSDHMAVVARDVDLSRGTLRPWRTSKFIGPQTGKALWREDCCTKVFTDCAASVAYHRMGDGRIIATDAEAAYPVTANLKEWCASDVCRLGFPCDLPAPAASAPPPAAFVRFDDARQVRVYAYRLLNRYNETSQISTPSATIEVDALMPVTVTVPTAFAGYCIDMVQILRSEQSPDRTGGQMDSQFFVVGEVALGVTTFTDDLITPLEMAEDLPINPPPDNLRDVQYWGNDQFIGLSDDTIVMTVPTEHHNWATANIRELHDKPIALAATNSVCYVATDARPAVIKQGNGSCDITEAEDTHPIVSKRSMVGYNNHALYASKDGIVMIAPSGQCKIVTAAYYAKDQWQMLLPDSMFAAVHDGHYFAFFQNETIRFKIPDGVYEDAGDIGLTTLSIRPTAAYRGLDDELYYTDAQGLWQWNAGTDWLEFYFQSAPIDAISDVEFAAFKVDGVFAPVTIEHWVDQERIDLDTVNTNTATWLPSARSGQQWGVTMRSKGEVRCYYLSTSIHDLGR